MELPPSLQRIVPGDLAKNPPLLTLVAANLITIVLAVAANWDLATVLFIYWAQSVIIGIFTVVSLLSADTESLAATLGKAQAEAGGSPVVGTGYVRFYKVVLAGFFALHYGLFHYAYYGVIIGGDLFGPVDLSAPGIGISCALFFANHLYSYLYHRGTEKRDADFVTREFFTPYNRIIPMHLTIIFGAILVLAFSFLNVPSTLPVLVLFLLLKTVLDVKMHLRKHYETLHPGEPVMYSGL